MLKSLLKGPLIIIFVVLSLSAWGAKIPDVQVANEFGLKTTLISQLEDKTILVMGFYHCKHMCNFVVKNLSQKLVSYKNYPKVVFFGIDENEGPRDALRLGKRIIGNARERWTFLIADRPEIKQMASALKFEMGRDPVSKTITHEMGIYAVNAKGEAKKLDELTMKESDLVVKSSQDNISTLAAIKKFCAEFDPSKSRSGMLVIRMLFIGSTLFLIAAGLGFMHLRRKSS
jgi:cytochrome oxidase Cu insertion factor (SCO1/SenC/PrrC family)